MFYHEFLIEGRTPGEVLRRHPDWKPLWNDANDGQYGRPAAFFQQLQRLNLAEAWSGVRDSIAFGYPCVQGGAQGANSSEDCLYLNVWTTEWPAKSRSAVTNHLLERLAESDRYDASGPYNDGIGGRIVEWLREQAKR